MDCGAASDTVDPEPTLDALADMQAGLLDDAAAARLRRLAREDPTVAAQFATLERVRLELRGFGQDAGSAPPVPPAVTARIGSALRAESHVGPRRVGSRLVRLVGALAAVVAVVVGTVTLLRTPAPPSIAAGTARPADFPLTRAQLVDLLRRPAELGPLTDPRHLGSCLAGLDYPASTAPLGATVLRPHGEPVVIVLLPEDASGSVRAVAVRATCSAADTGLLADTTFDHH